MTSEIIAYFSMGRLVHRASRARDIALVDAALWWARASASWKGSSFTDFTTRKTLAGSVLRPALQSTL